ncbi:MAG: hypothetical protein WEB04_11765 [Dehalococcoidia bacterium]
MIETGVSYFSSRDLRHVRADLEEMVAHGCSYVVHCFTETDLLYYRQSMADVLAATRDAGLESWMDPWGVTRIFSGETLSGFVGDHPEALQLLSDGRRVPSACPNQPETRRFLREWVAAAAEAGGRVAFWDEPHFYIPARPHGVWSGVWGCRCDACQERFRDEARRALPQVIDDEVRAFRERSLIDLLAELSAEAKRLGMRNCLCLLPTDYGLIGMPELEQSLDSLFRRRMEPGDGPPADPEPWRSFGIHDWDAAAAIADLDIFGCDPYWYFFGAGTQPEPFVRGFTRRTKELADKYNRDVQIWVQAFSVPEGREDELSIGLRVAVEEGATHVAAWSYRATESMSALRPARPDYIWELLGRDFRALRNS